MLLESRRNSHMINEHQRILQADSTLFHASVELSQIAIDVNHIAEEASKVKPVDLDNINRHDVDRLNDFHHYTRVGIGDLIKEVQQLQADNNKAYELIHEFRLGE